MAYLSGDSKGTHADVLTCIDDSGRKFTLDASLGTYLEKETEKCYRI